MDRFSFVTSIHPISGPDLLSITTPTGRPSKHELGRRRSRVPNTGSRTRRDFISSVRVTPGDGSSGQLEPSEALEASLKQRRGNRIVQGAQSSGSWA